MRASSPTIAIGLLAIATACGGADTRAEEPTSTSQATVVKGKPATTEGPAKQGEASAVAGVSPIQVASFVAFVGFRHGDDRDAATEVLTWTADGLGARKPLEMTGSEGFRYPGHLAISWSTEDSHIDYVSVRSKAAIKYLNGKGRGDARVEQLFGASLGEALGALGKPTLQADRPHAITYRYEFDTAGKKGTLTLEFDKLVSPPRCRSISVHWN